RAEAAADLSKALPLRVPDQEARRPRPVLRAGRDLDGEQPGRTDPGDGPDRDHRRLLRHQLRPQVQGVVAVRRLGMFTAAVVVATTVAAWSGGFGPGPNSVTIPSTGQSL